MTSIPFYGPVRGQVDAFGVLTFELIWVFTALNVLLIVAVGLAILASVDIPAPSGQIEKPIPADRVPH